MFDRRLLQNFDWILLLLLVLMAVISVANLYSATAAIRHVGGSQIFVKQIYWYLIGFSILLLMTTFDYHLLERLAFPAYFLALGLLGLVLVIGELHSGSRRWLEFGGVSFQVSELVKIVLVMTLARYFSEQVMDRASRLRDLWQPFLLIAFPCFLIGIEPDLGTALLLAIVSFSIILFTKVHRNSLVLLIVVFLLLAPLMWFFVLKDYQQDRVLSYISPKADPLGASYHVNQSKIAIGSGLFGGKGYLEGTQTRLRFLPEQHTDFVFSVFAEEWGFVGSVFLLLLYLFLILWGINIAKSSMDRFGSLLALGIVAIIFWQLFINVGMITGLLPVVGIPLVLLSYGGSSIVATMAGMGLLMNISMRRFMFQ
jgi:rod shape determining protein RodA